jgi:hypothetical protein
MSLSRQRLDPDARGCQGIVVALGLSLIVFVVAVALVVWR